jgi:hypothetical protein
VDNIKFSFDHTYMNILSPEAYLYLEKRGFTLSPDITEHPPCYQCRFLMFNNDNAFSKDLPFQYLEFVFIKSLETHQESLKARGVKLISIEDVLKPGVSLNASHNLESVFDRLSKEYKELKPEFEHRNYNWRENSKTKEAGWNFLNFQNPPFSKIEFWITEYEKNVNKKLPDKTVSQHANSATGILGFVWDKDFEEMKILKDMVDGEFFDDHFTFADGSKIWFQGPAVDDLIKFDKKYPYKAVILKCDSIELFIQVSKADHVIEWNGHRAAVLDINDIGWLLLAIESK